MVRTGSRRHRIDRSRRRLLLATGTVFAGLSGCIGTGNGGNPANERPETDDYDGPGVTPEGTPRADLPELSGELTIYSGRREAQIDEVLRDIESYYDDFGIEVFYDDNEALLQRIDEEGAASPADILYTQDSGTLGMLKRMDRTVELTDDVIKTVPEHWRDPDGTWTGLSGRTRCVAYNTDRWSPDELPDDIFAYPDDERFEGEMGWRVDSGSFRAFVQAMIIEHGESTTRAFLQGMLDAGIQNNEGGSTTPQAIAAGEISVGFVNQYYVGRLVAQDPDLPISVTFTDGDVGSLFNVSGAAVLDTSDRTDLARDFIRHLLGTESQEFFVETNSEYAVIEGVEYVGELPGLDELDPPAFDLNELAEIEPAIALLQDVGIY